VSATSELIEFVRRLGVSPLPESVLAHAKRCILDFIGVTIAGSQTSMARASAQFAYAQFGEGQATAIAFAKPLTPLGATWLNGISASALDLDDGHRPAMGHPGAAVIPAALAIAETAGASGLEFLVAVIAGYEVAVRASVSRKPAFKKGRYNTGIWGGFGAAAAAAKLLGLDSTRFDYALGIAFAHGPLVEEGVSLGMVKEGIGWAGVTGCAAALLAQQGFTGATDIFDQHLWHDAETLLQDLEGERAILRVYFKPYACCRWSHPAIDAVLQLASENDLAPREIRSVLVEGFNEARMLNDAEPDTLIAAQYSLPFCVALALSYRRVGLAEMTEANLHNPDLLRLARKVRIEIAADLDAQFPEKTATRTTIETARGIFATRVEWPRGSPENPLSAEEELDKFRSLVSPVLGPEHLQDLENTIWRLDRVPDVRAMTRYLADSKE
jgi:2-methylcitrate dehydratase PrpD